MSYYRYTGEMAESSDRLDLRGDVAQDSPCRQCSYNLRGLPKNGRCPECGSPIAVSIWGELLRFSHPDWLKKVNSGAILILWGALAAFVVGLFAPFMLRGEPALRHLLSMLTSLIGAVGIWKMTSPDPSGIGESSGMTARKVVRAVVISGVLAHAVQILTTSGIDTAIISAITTGLAIVGLAGDWAKYHYIGLLAERIPDDSLSGRAKFLKWAVPLSFGVAIVLSYMNRQMGGARGGAMAGMVCIALLAALAVVVFAIMALALIYRFARVIQDQIPMAEDLWNRAALRTQWEGHQVQPPLPPAQSGG